MEVIIGIDAGGTTTEFDVYDLEHQLLSNYSAMGSNLANNREHAIDTVLKGLKNVVTKDMHPVKIVIGMAGVVGNPLADILKERIWESYNAHVVLYNDVVFAHKAIFQNGAGLLLSGGTGSVAVINNEDRREYELIGGYGHLFGDEGSGYDIARRAIVHCTMLHDLQEKDDLTLAILDELQVKNIREAIPYLYRAVKGEIAGLSKIVASLADGGNKVAIDILEKSAYSYVEHIIQVIKKRNIKIASYALWGSVFLRNQFVSHVISSTIEKEFEIEKVTIGNRRISSAALYE